MMAGGRIRCVRQARAGGQGDRLAGDGEEDRGEPDLSVEGGAGRVRRRRPRTRSGRSRRSSAAIRTSCWRWRAACASDLSGHHQAPSPWKWRRCCGPRRADGRRHRPAGAGGAEGEGQVKALAARLLDDADEDDDDDQFVPILPMRRSSATRRRCLREYAHARGVDDRAADPHRGHRREAPEARHRVRRHAPAVRRAALGLGFDPDILGAIFSTTAASSSTKASTPRRTRRRKAAIASRWRTRAAGTGGCIAPVRPRTRRKVALSTMPAAAHVHLPVEPGQGAGRMAGRLLCLCLLMPRKLVFAAWDEIFPDASSASFSREPIDHPFVEIATTRWRHRRSFDARARRRSALEALRQAVRRAVPRLADRHAHPARKAWAAAPRGAASALLVRRRMTLFLRRS